MTTDPISPLHVHGDLPGHVAIIMDGNGRWARERGLPRHLGHREGMKAVREAIEGAVEIGIDTLTLFAFSTENWKRPAQEVGALMALLQLYARQELPELRARGVEVHVLGDLQRVDRVTRAAVDAIVEGTRGGTALRLNLMISYGGREELVRAARLLAERVRLGEIRIEDIDEGAVQRELFTCALPDPDLLIRTSGEHRISNFMLWQLAYTELYVTPVLWPDFDRDDLVAAIGDYQRRERRFGRVSAS